MLNYYEVLGIDYTSDTAVIAKAYRSLATKHHPDLVKDGASSNKIKMINQAYNVLSDIESKKRYDRENGFHESRKPFKYINKNALDKVKVAIHITVKEAYFGAMKTVRVTEFKECSCSGKYNCRNCNNTNKVNCGKVDIDVNIPRGITNGSYINIRTGDFVSYIGEIKIKKDAKFSIIGNDLFTYLNVGYGQLVLGDDLEIDLFGRSVPIRVPSRFSIDKKICVEGEGMPIASHPNERGDLYLTLKLIMPAKLDGKYTKILKQLKEVERNE